MNDPAWLHKFYAPGTPPEITESVNMVTAEEMGFYQQKYVWFRRHPAASASAIHVNPKSVLIEGEK